MSELNAQGWGRRSFIKLGLASGATLSAASTFSVLSGCSSAPNKPANNFLNLRESDIALLKIWVPVIIVPEARPNGDDDVDRIIERLDNILDSAIDDARKQLLELFDLLQLGLARRWLFGTWQAPETLSFEERTEAIKHWQAKESVLARTAFQAVTNAIMMSWYSDPQAAIDTGYPGPPKKIVA